MAQAHDILEALDDGAALLDGEGRVMSWNRAARAGLGWEAVEVLGRPFSEQIMAAGAPRDLDRRIGWERDLDLLRKDGGREPTFMSGIPLRNGLSDYVGSVAAWRLRGPGRLPEVPSEEPWAGTLVKDIRGRIILWNRGFFRLWGLSESCYESGDELRTLVQVLAKLSDPFGFITRYQQISRIPEGDYRDVLKLREHRLLERHAFPFETAGQVVGQVFRFREIQPGD